MRADDMRLDQTGQVKLHASPDVGERLFGGAASRKLINRQRSEFEKRVGEVL